MTTRSKRFSVIDSIDTTDSGYMENLIINDSYSPQSNNIIHTNTHSPQLNDIDVTSTQSKDIKTSIKSNSQSPQSNDIHLTISESNSIDRTAHKHRLNKIEVFDLTDSPEVASVSRLNLNPKNISRSTIELISSLEELNASNDSPIKESYSIVVCLPCNSTIITDNHLNAKNIDYGNDGELWNSTDNEINKKNENNKNKSKADITKRNNYGDDDELWDSDYKTNKKTDIDSSNNKSKANITKSSSYCDDDELWDSDYDVNMRIKNNNIADTNIDAFNYWDENSIILTHELPPRLITKVLEAKGNSISINSSDESDEDDFMNNDSNIDDDNTDVDNTDENAQSNFNKSNTMSRVIPLAKRKQTSKDMFATFNRVGFDSLLPPDMSIVWSKRLLTTAGITKMKTVCGIRLASIELSIKVVDDEVRIINTLLHEMCHAAAWVIDGEKKPPHGKRFWHWANKCERKIENANITTCHVYEIFKPFRYECTNIDCKTLYSRHAKNSIDINKHRCGKCRSNLEYLGRFDQNGNTKKERAPKDFSLFVKENYSNVMKSRRPSQGKKAKDIILVLSKMYKEKSNDISNNGNENQIIIDL